MENLILLDTIKEENDDIEIKQEEVNFELIEEEQEEKENYLIDGVKEESILSKEIGEEEFRLEDDRKKDETDEIYPSNMMEFTYVGSESEVKVEDAW